MTSPSKTGSLRETPLRPREDYSASIDFIKGLRPIPLEIVEWLEAMTPTYESILDGSGSFIDTSALNKLQGQRETCHILRSAYNIQQQSR